MGPPGSGKGTQSKELAANQGIPQVATGDLIRAHIAQGSDQGKAMEGYVHAGQFPPDQLILDILAARIQQEDCSHGFILDGFPRNRAQAKALDKYLKSNKIQPHVILLDISDQEVKERMIGRQTCEQCHRPYHSRFAPPRKEGVCDHCGSSLIRRSDDTEKVIAYRLQVYHQETQPLIEYYEKKGALHRVDASQPKAMVTAEILKTLQRHVS